MWVSRGEPCAGAALDVAAGLEGTASGLLLELPAEGGVSSGAESSEPDPSTACADGQEAAAADEPSDHDAEEQEQDAEADYSWDDSSMDDHDDSSMDDNDDSSKDISDGSDVYDISLAGTAPATVQSCLLMHVAFGCRSPWQSSRA